MRRALKHSSGSSNPIHDNLENDDLLGIIGWAAANSPLAASSVGQRILDAVERLLDHIREWAAAGPSEDCLSPRPSPRERGEGLGNCVDRGAPCPHVQDGAGAAADGT
jgi:hypothetical protein